MAGGTSAFVGQAEVRPFDRVLRAAASCSRRGRLVGIDLTDFTVWSV